MHIHISFYLIATLTCFRGAHGWKLDKSCQANGLESIIAPIVTDAITMASTSRTALNALNNQDVRNVAQWMMLPDNQTPNTANMNDLSGIFNNIMTYQSVRKNDDLPNSAAAPMDFVVYCDMSRFEQRPSDKRWVDTEYKETFSDEDNEDWNECRTLSGTLAFTKNSIRGDKPSQIQLCPWFIEWIKGPTILKSFTDIGAKAWLADKIVIPLIKTFNWPYTQIDLTSLFDKVMLHEITHTTGAGSSDDVDQGVNVRYGWNKCRALAQESPAYPRNPEHNADSVALVGSGIRFIMDTQSPQRVTIEGLLEPIT